MNKKTTLVTINICFSNFYNSKQSGKESTIHLFQYELNFIN